MVNSNLHHYIEASLRKLADLQHHYQIGPEVKRELSQGRSRGEKDDEMGGDGGGVGGGVGYGNGNGKKGGAGAAGGGGVAFGGFSTGTRAKAVVENVRDMPGAPKKLALGAFELQTHIF